ncbi:hypothetical protein BK144_24740, partial [Paenibacillus sp. FSL R7-0273]
KRNKEHSYDKYRFYTEDSGIRGSHRNNGTFTVIFTPWLTFRANNGTFTVIFTPRPTFRANTANRELYLCL